MGRCRHAWQASSQAVYPGHAPRVCEGRGRQGVGVPSWLWEGQVVMSSGARQRVGGVCVCGEAVSLPVPNHSKHMGEGGGGVCV